MFDEYDDIITVDELCEMLKIGKNNAYKIIQSGKIKCFKNGRTWRIPKDSVIKFVIEISKGV